MSKKEAPEAEAPAEKPRKKTLTEQIEERRQKLASQAPQKPSAAKPEDIPPVVNNQTPPKTKVTDEGDKGSGTAGQGTSGQGQQGKPQTRRPNQN